MTTDEIKNLGKLARIALSPDEVGAFSQEIDAILDYVSVVKDIVAASAAEVPTVGVRYNVLRQDAVTNTPGQYTTDMFACMPHIEGQYLSVKKILKQND